MLAKITGNKIILFGLIGVLAGLVVAVMLLVVLKSPPPATPTPEVKVAAKPGAVATAPGKAGAAGKGAPAAAPAEAGDLFGDTYLIKDKIVNLADPGGRRYLRFTVALVFWEPPKAAAASYQAAVYQPGDGG